MGLYTINNLPAPIDFETREFVARTLQNAKNLLRCYKGEVPYDRMKGIDPAVYHKDYARLQAVITQEVERVLRWEPDVNVQAARCKILSDTELYIEADVEIEEGED